MEHMGIEPGRLHFSWVSSAESTKFVDVVKEVTDTVKQLGPNRQYIKQKAKVA
jgi:coenzyme F420-reducing hydrogenase delta subunit